MFLHLRLLLHLALICITLTVDIISLHYTFTTLNVPIIFDGDSVLFSHLFHLNTLGYSGKYWPTCCWNFPKIQTRILDRVESYSARKEHMFLGDRISSANNSKRTSLTSFILSHTNFRCEFLVSHICSLLKEKVTRKTMYFFPSPIKSSH